MNSANITSSAILFVGSDFTKKRLTDMTWLETGKRKTFHAKRHNNWVKYLTKHVHDGLELSDKEEAELFAWAQDYRMDTQHFQSNLLVWCS